MPRAALRLAWCHSTSCAKPYTALVRLLLPAFLQLVLDVIPVDQAHSAQRDGGAG